MQIQQEFSIFRSETGFKTLFNHVETGLILVDKKGSIIQLNKYTEKLFGYTNKELEGQNLSSLISSKAQDNFKHCFLPFLKKTMLEPLEKSFVFPACTKNKEDLIVEVKISLSCFENKNFTFVFITKVTDDSNERKQIEKLTVELEKEKELNRIKTHFVSLASHEFRTPLSTILSSISLIKKYIEICQLEKTNKHIKRITESVNNLSSLMNDFLSLDKLEQGVIRINNEWFDINELLRETCKDLDDYLKDGQIIKLIPLKEDSIIRSDKTLCKNIFINLLSNASKYSNEHKEIKITLHTEKNHVVVTITDEGIGIPLAEQDKLFSIFYRGSNVGQTEGTGLGLNIVVKYIALLNGLISFSSIENEGSTFKLMLPLENTLH